jgi:hypothetical protein
MSAPKNLSPEMPTQLRLRVSCSRFAFQLGTVTFLLQVSDPHQPYHAYFVVRFGSLPFHSSSPLASLSRKSASVS